MKRPWQIWLFFSICLVVSIATLAWVTWHGLMLDQAEREARTTALKARSAADAAREQTELEKKVGDLLWRLDWMLAPLMAQEAGRPYFVYDAFYVATVPTKSTGGVTQLPSPLLLQPSEYVLLHFQVSPEDQWTSPQSPAPQLCSMAISCGAKTDQMDVSGKRLQELQQSLDHSQLLAWTPDLWLPQFETAVEPWGANMLLGFSGPRTDPVLDNRDLYSNNAYNIASAASPPARWNRSRPPSETQQQQVDQAEFPSQRPAQVDDSTQPSRAEQFPAQQSVTRQTVTPQSLDRQSDAEPQRNAPLTQSPTAQRMGSELRQQESQASSASEWVAPAYSQRSEGLQTLALNMMRMQRGNDPTGAMGREGVSRPIWVDGKLLLTRRMKRGEQLFVQGCWFDWDKIETVLDREVGSLLPNAHLRPLQPSEMPEPGRLLATLPVQLDVPDVVPQPITDEDLSRTWSAIQVALTTAWLGLGTAVLAVGFLLAGVVRLSERRGAFVSAVTHELRTPLTTFRMYAEMLSERMIPDREKEDQYLNTLRVEADRLSHLVENVLQYARLERGRPGRKRVPIQVATLQNQFETRLVDRAEHAAMKLVTSSEPDVQTLWIQTDATAVEQILFNLVDNAAKYASRGQDRRIHLDWRYVAGKLRISISDHGPGIQPSQRRKLFLPFSKSVHEAAESAPGVGLGLALCQRLAIALGGSLTYEPNPGGGARFVLTLAAAQPSATSWEEPGESADSVP